MTFLRYDIPFHIYPFNPNPGDKDEGFVEPAARVSLSGEGVRSEPELSENPTGFNNNMEDEEEETNDNFETKNIDVDEPNPVIYDQDILSTKPPSSVLNELVKVSSSENILESLSVEPCCKPTNADVLNTGNVTDSVEDQPEHQRAIESPGSLDTSPEFSNHNIRPDITKPENTFIDINIHGDKSSSETLSSALALDLEETILDGVLEVESPEFYPPELPSRDPSPQTNIPECCSQDEENGLDIGSEDYVDERQLEEYLKQIKMENSEEKLIQDYFPESCSPSPSENDSLRTGARPKRRQDALLQDGLEPMIRTPEGALGKQVQAEEFDIPQDDLEPRIGSKKNESPPPYCEVDPRIGEFKPVRPLTLNLEQNDVLGVQG